MLTKSLNDVFSNWINGGGIFANITQNFNVPWKGEIAGDILDLDYHGNRSGGKIIAPLVSKLLDDNGEINPENTAKLVNLIYLKYGKNWKKLWDTLSLDYNPIENYSMTETEKSSGTSGETIEETTGGKDTTKETGTDTLTKSNTNTTSSTSTTSKEYEEGGSDAKDTSGTTTTKNSVYGFNSTTAVGDTESETEPNTSEETTYGKTESETGTQTESGTITDSGTDTQTKNLQTETTYGKTNDIERSGTNSLNRTLTRAGNIGVTTSQQMIESERELWVWNFFDTVFADVDTVTVLQVFKNDFC